MWAEVLNKKLPNVKPMVLTQEEIDIRRVLTEYKSMYENHMWRRWAKWYRDYLLDWSDREQQVLWFQSNIKVPIVKQYVDALWTSVYDNQINFKTTGRNKDSYAKAASAHDYLSWAFTRSMSWPKLMDAVKECVIEWNWYVKVWFKNKVEEFEYTKRYKDKNWKLKTKTIKWTETEKYPDLNYVSIFNIFHPLYIEDIKDSPVVIERNILHYSKILSRYSHISINKEKFNTARYTQWNQIFNYDFDKIKMSAFWDRAWMKKELDKFVKNSTTINDITQDNFFDILMNNYLHINYDWWFCEVIEYWEWKKFKLIVNWYVVYSWDNPLPDKRHPYEWIIFNKIPWMPHGRWIALSLSDIQDTADDMMNLAIDNQKFLVAPMFERIKWWDIFSESDWIIEWQPFKAIEVNQKNAITRLDIWNPNLAWLSWGIDFLFQIWEMSEWINSYATWYQNKVERSATWVSALVQSFKARLLPMIDSLNQALTWIAKKWLLYWMVYFDWDVEIEKFTDWKSVIKSLSIDELMWEYSIEFNAQSLKTASRELKRESLLNLLNAILPFAQMLKENNATKFKADDFLKDVFDTYELNPEKYFTANTREFIRDEVKTEQAKMKISKKLQEWVIPTNDIHKRTASEIFADNAKAEQIANQAVANKEWTEDLEATPWVDETTVPPLSWNWPLWWLAWWQTPDKHIHHAFNPLWDVYKK